MLRFYFYVAVAKVCWVLSMPFTLGQMWATKRVLTFYSPEEQERLKQNGIMEAQRKMG